jgi:hypothetical protein
MERLGCLFYGAIAVGCGDAEIASLATVLAVRA